MRRRCQEVRTYWTASALFAWIRQRESVRQAGQLDYVYPLRGMESLDKKPTRWARPPSREITIDVQNHMACVGNEYTDGAVRPCDDDCGVRLDSSIERIERGDQWLRLPSRPDRQKTKRSRGHHSYVERICLSGCWNATTAGRDGEVPGCIAGDYRTSKRSVGVARIRNTAARQPVRTSVR